MVSLLLGDDCYVRIFFWVLYWWWWLGCVVFIMIFCGFGEFCFGFCYGLIIWCSCWRWSVMLSLICWVLISERVWFCCIWFLEFLLLWWWVLKSLRLMKWCLLSLERCCVLLWWFGCFCWSDCVVDWVVEGFVWWRFCWLGLVSCWDWWGRFCLFLWCFCEIWGCRLSGSYWVLLRVMDWREWCVLDFECFSIWWRWCLSWIWWWLMIW